MLQVKVLGALAMIDGGETDWKILAVRTDDPLAQQVRRRVLHAASSGDRPTCVHSPQIVEVALCIIAHGSTLTSSPSHPHVLPLPYHVQVDDIANAPDQVKKLADDVREWFRWVIGT